MCSLPERELSLGVSNSVKLTCSQSEKMEHLEKTQSWKEEEFDVVLQFMRTILLRRTLLLQLAPPSRKMLMSPQTAPRSSTPHHQCRHNFKRWSTLV